MIARKELRIMEQEYILQREKEEEYELNNFLYAEDMNEKLFDYLSINLADYKPKKEYIASYYQYVKKSPRAYLNIRLNGIKWLTNTSISLNAYMCGFKEKPFWLNLWK